MVASNGRFPPPATSSPQRMRMPGIATSMVQRIPAITTPTELTTPHDPLADITRKRTFPQMLGPDGMPLQGKDKDERAIGLAFPHVMGFVARMTGGWGSYWHGRYDECLKFNREYANTMRNDAFLSALLWERMCAVYRLIRSWHLEIPNAADPFQIRVRDAVTAVVRSNLHLGRIIWCLLDAIWYGRQGAQIQWGWTKSPDPNKDQALTVLDWQPIQGDKIGHQFIDIETQHYIEQPYILVDGGRVGWLKDHGAKLITTTMGWAMTLQGDWRERFIIHRHLIEDSDWWAPEKADAVHGLGVRSKIFWANWLKWEWLANITDFFDRVGLGITVWRYPQGNAAALAAIKQAADDQSQRAHIFVPVPEGTEQHQSGIERLEVPSGGSEFLYKMIEYLDGYIERYIVGQEASSRGSKTGLGGQGAQFQAETKSAITMFDADMLAQTLTGSEREPGLLNTIVKYTYPEADFPLIWRFDQADQQDEKKLTSIKTLVDMGVKVKADDARSAAGLSKPIEGDEIIQPPQQPGMPPGSPPGLGGSPIAQPGQGGTTQQPMGQQAGEAGGADGGASVPGGPTGQPSATPNEQSGSEGGANWLPANTGVSPETGQPLSDSRYVNEQTGSVKHFPQGPGEGENGKPVAGQRLQTTTPETPQPTEGIEGHPEVGGQQQPVVKENAGPAVESPPQEKPPIEDEQNASKRLTRNAFQYTDHASMLDQTCSLCRFFDGQKSQCKLFEQLNAAAPLDWNLQVQVKPTGWCDQWQSARRQGEPDVSGKTLGDTEVPAATQTEGPHQYSRDSKTHQKDERVKTLWMVRHGKTKLNAANPTQDRIRGWLDIPLTDEGLQEAHRLATWFKNKPLQAIVASDLERSEETAMTIALVHHTEIRQTTRALRPWNVGKYSGELSSKVHPVLEKYVVDKPDERIADGESFYEFKKRCLDYVTELLRLEFDKPVLAVSHFRNLKLVQAWAEAGMNPDFDIDMKTFLNWRDLPTGSILKLTHVEGEPWEWEIIKIAQGQDEVDRESEEK